MLQEVISHKCPNCAAKIEFDIFTQNFTCRFCGSAFSKEQMEELYPTDELTKEFIKENAPKETQQQRKDKEYPACLFRFGHLFFSFFGFREAVFFINCFANSANSGQPPLIS